MATTYNWKGRSPSGELLSGEYQTENKEELISYLRKRKIIITSVREKGAQLAFKLPIKDRITVKDIGVFTRQFATMINAGLPMVQCLDILAQQTEKAFLKQSISRVMTDVEGGSTLAEAMARHPKIFSQLYVNMVEAGEAGGILDVILIRLATFLEKLDVLQRKVKSALTYPAVVAFVASGATAFMLIFIIPTFARMFSDFGGELPLPTRIVISLSNFLRNFWWAIGASIAGAVIALQRYYKTDSGRLTIDKLPAFRTAFVGVAQSHFTGINDAPAVEVDAEVDLAELDLSGTEELERLAPFGASNAEPLLAIPGVVARATRVVGGTHLQLTLSRGAAVGDAIAFGMADRDPGRGSAVHVIGTAEVDSYRGYRRTRLRVRHLLRGTQ